MARNPLSVSVFIITALIGISHTDFHRPTPHHQVSKLSAYEVTIPRRLSLRERRQTTSAQDKLSYAIEVEGREHIVHLKRNQDFLPKGFTVSTYSNDGNLLTSRPNMQKHCHYLGYVEGIENSIVALSTCSGLRGFLQTGETYYGIEPLENSKGFQHLIYRMEDLQEEASMCGVSDLSSAQRDSILEPTEQHSHDGQSMTGFLRHKRAILPQTHYVELFLVVEKQVFEIKRNTTAIREEAVQIANYIDGIYIPLNIRVVLVGLEIWSKQNLINTQGGAAEVLGRFVQWRQKDLLLRQRHDSAHLILKKGFGGTAGMAFVGTICSRSHSGGINVYSSRPLYFASIVAHELGHNLGMNHDNDRGCICSSKSCIMNAGATGAQNFSSCSADDFEAMILKKGASCLWNIPRPDESYSPPSCGNRLVDAGEECDCGSPKECEKDPCCEASTCKLKYGVQCAFGSCCKHCQFIAAGTVCRASNNECDFAEHCSGESHLCQPDVFVQDGHPCQNNNAYCYNGMCQSYDSQCVALFGQHAKSAPEVCFQDVNSKGDRFGNCGASGAGHKKCDSRNAMCGKLQCENVDSVPVFGIQPSIIQTRIGGTTCWGVDFRLGSDVPDPGMVNPGTRCTDGKICMDFKCVNASILKYDCDVQKKCNGQGVCNSNKNCHCNMGWAPPDCVVSGYGGSVDSGPTYNDKDTSLRDGLLVFFLLVVPLMALAAFAFVKRNQLQRRFCRKKRSQIYKSEPRTGSEVPGREANNAVKEGVNLLPSQQVVQTTRTSLPIYTTKPSHLTPSRPPPPRPAPTKPGPKSQKA
uniref:Disintegrin and metalloproteinase domain-containing protein 9 n=2 Tax=Callorhinchus milii TaxID=7868 RepID=V9KEC9_CALMI